METTDVEPGKLNKRVTVQLDTGTDKTLAGEHVENWVTWTALPNGIWCAIRGLSGREVERAAQMQVYATLEITMRWVPGLTAVKMRAIEGSRIFDFGYVNNLNEEGIWAKILASERIA